MRGYTLRDLFNINTPPVSSIRVWSLRPDGSPEASFSARACPGRRTHGTWVRPASANRPRGPRWPATRYFDRAQVRVPAIARPVALRPIADGQVERVAEHLHVETCVAGSCVVHYFTAFGGRGLCKARGPLGRCGPIGGGCGCGWVRTGLGRGRRAALSAIWCRQGLHWRAIWSRPVGRWFLTEIDAARPMPHRIGERH